MKVIFATNIPSPYRVDFFNELGKYCELTVLYERKKSTERDNKWVAEQANNFNEVYLNLEPVGTDRSKGNALKDYIKEAKFDILILTNYVSPAIMRAIIYCKIHKIPYYIEYDGGFDKKETWLKRQLKKYLLCSAKGHLTTADTHINYLKKLGVDENIIYKYPFSSIKASDIVEVSTSLKKRKMYYRKKLGIKEKHVILSVGQFIHRKGFDMLINAASNFGDEIGIFIIGGKPTEEYLKMRNETKCNNLHFIGFMSKRELTDWYQAADLFAMTTREDVWGLVVNEAMAYGLPVISSDMCGAASEMVKNGYNGYIFENENTEQLTARLKKQLELLENTDVYCINAQQTAKRFTIEEMAKRHMFIFEQIID